VSASPVEALGFVVLGYGEEVDLGGIIRASEKSGVTGTNPGGHGFTLAKARQRLF
jgi:hypothetical protein